MSLSLKRMLALWTLGLIGSEELPSIAAEVLAEGLESRSLVRLAGLTTQEIADADSLFQKSLNELGVEQMTTNEALRLYAVFVSKRIVNREISPLQGAKEIWRATIRAKISDFHALDPFIYA